jgi:LysR family transcriptional regulator, transcriptional activator of nhaA
VRHGTLRRASEELNLSAPAISAQLKTLEARLGVKLLEKSGRTLVPTEAGRLVYQYADDIFGLGRDLLAALEHRPTTRPMRLTVGIDDVLPKEIAHRLLEPALAQSQPLQLTCREGTLEHLVAELSVHAMDVVLSDSPVTPSLNIRAYNHHLGTCDELWMAAPAIAKRLRTGFPKSLHGAPVLLPTDDTAIRRALDQWLDRNDVRPSVVGEFEDYALLREFARAGAGLAPVPAVLETQFRRQYGLSPVGVARGVRAEFYAISVERKIKHPALLAISDTAHQIFGH